MNIKKISLILWAISISNIYNTAYKATTPQLIRKTTKPKTFYKPKAFNAYQSALPLSAAQINKLLLKQTPQIQNKISRHPFFKELIIEIPSIEITRQSPIKFNEKTLLKLEIFMYCINHPQEAEEIMNFYQEIKDADHLIKDRLELLPPHAQEFFKQQVQKYLNSEEIYEQDIHSIKAKILKLYPYIITSLKLGFSILILIVYFKAACEVISENLESLDPKNIEEQHLLELLEILTDALNLNPINLYKVKPTGPMAKSITGIAAYAYLPFVKHIIVVPDFFKQNLDTQIFILLHELRHCQQHVQITIPQDVIEYAQKNSVNPLALNFINFFKTGFFWSSAMLDFDADLFAARQMKNYPWIKNVATDLKLYLEFNPQKGYLSKEMILKESPYGTKNLWWIYLEKLWDKFINSQPNENMYLRYVPQHLKEAAEKNKPLREEKKQALQEAQQIFEEYREF